MKSATIAVVLIILVIIAGIVIVKYNKMAALDERVTTAWTSLEGILKSRYDSVPRLAGAITLYVGHDIAEDDELEKAYPAFAAAKTVEERAKAANSIEDAVQKLAQSVAERYPGITSNAQVAAMIEVFKKSKAEMGGRLAEYNSASTAYNTYIRKFPNDIVAGFLGFATKYVYIEPQL